MIDVLQFGLFYENIMRIVPRKRLRYLRDDHDHFNHEDTLVDNAPADPAGPAIGRIRSATDRRFMYRGSFAGGRSWLTLSRPLELLSQPRWQVAIDRLIAPSILTAGKTDLEADMERLPIAEPSDVHLH